MSAISVLRAAKAMQQLRRATVRQLQDALDCKNDTAIKYMKDMRTVGLVRMTGEFVKGAGNTSNAVLWAWLEDADSRDPSVRLAAGHQRCTGEGCQTQRQTCARYRAPLAGYQAERMAVGDGRGCLMWMSLEGPSPTREVARARVLTIEKGA